jgi:hypothetical protein
MQQHAACVFNLEALNPGLDVLNRCVTFDKAFYLPEPSFLVKCSLMSLLGSSNTTCRIYNIHLHSYLFPIVK